jgi:hypothetical protein
MGKFIVFSFVFIQLSDNSVLLFTYYVCLDMHLKPAKITKLFMRYGTRLFSEFYIAS